MHVSRDVEDQLIRLISLFSTRLSNPSFQDPSSVAGDLPPRQTAPPMVSSPQGLSGQGSDGPTGRQPCEPLDSTPSPVLSSGARVRLGAIDRLYRGGLMPMVACQVSRDRILRAVRSRALALGLCQRWRTLSWLVSGLLLEGTVLGRLLGPVLIPVDRLVLLLLRGFGVGLRTLPGWVLPVVLTLWMGPRWSLLWGPLSTLVLEGIRGPRPC